MKKYIKFLLPAMAAGVLATACNDLDVLPQASYVTAEQKAEVVGLNPDLAAAGVDGIAAQLNTYNSIFGNHIDFGWPSAIIFIETRGMDCPSELNGFNWYSPALQYSDWGGRYFSNLVYWYYNYYTIRSANDVLGSIQNPEDPQLKYFRAQGLVYRAYCYFNLAQMYQFTYVKDPNAKCVPIITDENSAEAASVGCPAGTVEEVYAQVLKDINEAIPLLADAEAAGLNRYSMTSSARMAKTQVNSTVAYALRARVNLFKADFDAAASDAEKAIELATEENLRPYTIAEASVPAFVTNTDPTYIWANFADASSGSRWTGVVTFASHFTGFQTNGYSSTGVYKKINKALYETIPSSDARKKWWLDGEGNYPSSLPANYMEVIDEFKDSDDAEPFPPYAQLKFGAPDGTPGTNGALDNPLLRVEELYLIEAEALGMKSPAAGAAKLTEFVSTYRDPSYSYTATDANTLRDEIWRQRRIEFWGEGLAYWDLQRLQKTMDRRGAGFDAECVFVVAPDDVVRLYDIPESEIQRNPLLGRTANGSVTPSPVQDY